MSDKKRRKAVVKAKKTIPRHKRAGRWIKAHQRQITLTLEALGALAVQYWFFKRRLMKLERDFAKKSTGLAKSSAMLASKAEEMASSAAGRTKITAEMQAKQFGLQQKMAERLQNVEKMLASAEFRKWLKEKHGITDIEKLREGKR